MISNTAVVEQWISVVDRFVDYKNSRDVSGHRQVVQTPIQLTDERLVLDTRSEGLVQSLVTRGELRRFSDSVHVGTPLLVESQ
jgi:hypothetical protein